METKPNDHRLPLALAAAAVLACALGAVRPAGAQPGSLQQLFRPDGCTIEDGDGIDCLDGVGLDGVQDVEVSPDGMNVYVASLFSNAVAVFARDPLTGALTQLAAPDGCVADNGDDVTCRDGLGLFGASAIAVSRDNRHVYVASTFSATLTVFDRDPVTGALTQLAAPAGCVAQDGGGASGCSDALGPIAPSAVELSPDGRYVYTAALNGDALGVFARDTTTGALTQLPAPAGCIAEGGDGIDCTAGVGLDGPRDLVLSRNGRHLYVASGVSDAVAVFKRSKSTGALTQRPAPDGCVAEDGDGVTCTDAVGLDGASSVVVTKNGKHVYVASFSSDAVAAFSRDATTGALTQLPAPGGCLAENGDGVTCTDAVALNGPRALALTKKGEQLYVASISSDAVTVFQRNKMSGVLTQLAAPNGCYSGSGDGVTCRGGLALDGASSLIVTKNGRNVYAGSSGADGGVAVFERQP